MLFVLVVVVVFVFSSGVANCADANHDWGYKSKGGTNEWCEVSPLCCGNQQSPINFQTSVLLPEYFPPIKFQNYDLKAEKIQLINNGHTIKVEMTHGKDNIPSMEDGGLAGHFQFAQFHFHWGSYDEKGSEHSIDGFSYPLELHMVHWNTKYENLNMAIKNGDGLAVTGIMYQISNNDNPVLNEIINELSNVQFKSEKKELHNVKFTLADLLPKSTDSFFRYQGSLTTPNCEEVVEWTVFEVPQLISAKQLAMFRKITINERSQNSNDSMSDNFRPVQKIAGRKIRRRVSSASSSISGSSYLFLLLTLIATNALKELHN